MKNNVIQEKSFSFALRILKLSQDLEECHQYVIARQILKSGTSIGANVEEAIGGQSRPDFFAKLTIAYKEARETSYWLRLLKEGKIINDEKAISLLSDCEELMRILTSIQKTTKGVQELAKRQCKFSVDLNRRF